MTGPLTAATIGIIYCSVCGEPRSCNVHPCQACGDVQFSTRANVQYDGWLARGGFVEVVEGVDEPFGPWELFE